MKILSVRIDDDLDQKLSFLMAILKKKTNHPTSVNY